MHQIQVIPNLQPVQLVNLQVDLRMIKLGGSCFRNVN